MAACSAQRGYRVTDLNVKGWWMRPAHLKNTSKIYLSVGPWSKFIYQEIALNVLFLMRYNGSYNSKKQTSDSKRAEATSVFTSLYYCHSLQPQKHVSTIWSFTQSFLGGDYATISHLKEEILSYLGIQKF